MHNFPAYQLREDSISGVKDGGIGLYIHIPFCKTKCHYCDFNTYAGIVHLLPDYLDALANELTLWGRALRSPLVSSVFLGGGTPSLVPPELLAPVLEAVDRGFKVVNGAEMTVEANPDDVNEERMASFSAVGVNRLSIGVQSLDDRLLHSLNRRHNATRAVEAYHCVRKMGFGNVSLDLMFGLPNQDLDDWRRTLERVVGMRPEHLSAYCLTLEVGTPMEEWVRKGFLPEPDPDLAADMYLLAEGILGDAGYDHYEISNWCLPGFESRHNLTYWRNSPYLGVGPGAHSYLGGNRFYNLASPTEYILRVQGCMERDVLSATMDESTLLVSGAVEAVEAISLELEMGETAMLGLRLAEGISLEEFRLRFGKEFLEVFDGRVDELVDAGLIYI